MNRIVFIVVQIILSIVFFVLHARGVYWAGGMLLLSGMIVVIQGRHYLGLKPFWFAKLKDIPKYFAKP